VGVRSSAEEVCNHTIVQALPCWPGTVMDLREIMSLPRCLTPSEEQSSLTSNETTEVAVLEQNELSNFSKRSQAHGCQRALGEAFQSKQLSAKTAYIPIAL
jgi:hypothetical protein